MGEPSVARLLAASRVARPYPPDRVLNPAEIGLNAGRAEFQMRATVAVWQHAWRTNSASRWAGRRHTATGSPGSNQKTRDAIGRS